jgi:hypothetical protein
MEKEVNRLIFQKQSENIVAFKELWDKEQRKKRTQEKNKDLTGLTSSHHMALEAAIRRIKVILAEKRKKRQEEARQRALSEANRSMVEVSKHESTVKNQSSIKDEESKRIAAFQSGIGQL